VFSKNNILFLSIAVLYFGNYHISLFLSNGNNDFYWDVNKAVYSLIIILSIHYKYKDIFIEKLFLSIVFNNIYVLIFKKEYNYTMHDIYFIAIFTAIQYVKQLYRNYSEYLIRIMAVYLSNKSKK
jgi:hypothetical protein